MTEAWPNDGRWIRLDLGQIHLDLTRFHVPNGRKAEGEGGWTRSLLSPSCSTVRRPRWPYSTWLGLLDPSGGASEEAAGEAEKRKSSSWNSPPAMNEGSVGDDEGDNDDNIPMNRSLASDQRYRYSSMGAPPPL